MAEPAPNYRLRLRRLDFVSAVDAGAQGPISNVALIKRADSSGFEAVFKVARTDESLGLVFGWAMAGTLDGGVTPHIDFQDDAIDVNGDDFLKVCAEFMEGGAAADVMHDGEQDGRIVFAFPLIPEINKALGIETKTHGLAIAMKPSPETFKRFQSGELAAFSIGGHGERTPLGKSTARKSNEKRYITDEVAGHQHEAGIYVDGSTWMSGATVEGGTSDHRHTIIRDAEGKLVVLADAGHTHTLTEVPRVLVAPEGVTVVPEAVAMRATHESPRAAKSQNVNPVNKETAVDELAELKALNVKLEAKIAELEAANADLEATAELTDEEKARAASLAGSEQKRFLALDKVARKVELEKAREADPVVAVIGKDVYRKSTAGSELAIKFIAQQAEIEKAKVRDIAKAVLSGAPGDEDTHAALVKSIRASGESDEMQTKMVEAIKGLVVEFRAKSKAAGFDGSTGEGAGADADAKIEALARKHATENKVPFAKAYATVLETEEGRALYAQRPAALKA